MSASAFAPARSTGLLGSALLSTGRNELLSGCVPNRTVTVEYKTLLRVDSAKPEQGAPRELDCDQDLFRPHALPERGQAHWPASNQCLFTCCFGKRTGPIERQAAQRGDASFDQRLCVHLVSSAIHWPLLSNSCYPDLDSKLVRAASTAGRIRSGTNRLGIVSANTVTRISRAQPPAYPISTLPHRRRSVELTRGHSAAVEDGRLTAGGSCRRPAARPARPWDRSPAGASAVRRSARRPRGAALRARGGCARWRRWRRRRTAQ